ncbi:Lrp/AsnC family transcriptional regulator [Leeia oryzae]|uniref:Lrp/AsnC family transcriptional regulator n=1 Tax=Leeia oryzae TaxID=356662 RepID=UPI00035C660A|nr:Lrp/AsnC family transcriptional regulator [Leeia oryzae]
MMDWIDITLLTALQRNARTSLANLARALNMSGPSVSERLKRLEEQRVIEAYVPVLNIKSLGYTLEAIVRMQPLPGQLKALEKQIIDTPNITECDKVTGEDCFIARLVLRDITELDEILDGFSTIAMTATSIVKSSPVKRRTPPLQSAGRSTT